MCPRSEVRKVLLSIGRGATTSPQVQLVDGACGGARWDDACAAEYVGQLSGGEVRCLSPATAWTFTAVMSQRKRAASINSLDALAFSRLTRSKDRSPKEFDHTETECTQM